MQHPTTYIRTLRVWHWHFVLSQAPSQRSSMQQTHTHYTACQTALSEQVQMLSHPQAQVGRPTWTHLDLWLPLLLKIVALKVENDGLNEMVELKWVGSQVVASIGVLTQIWWILGNLNINTSQCLWHSLLFLCNQHSWNIEYVWVWQFPLPLSPPSPQFI